MVVVGTCLILGACNTAVVVHPTTAPEHRENGQVRVALCLSGGGYRAALFHLGVLWRLNELGVLPHIDRLAAVSGGSISLAHLMLHWRELTFAPSDRNSGVSDVATNFYQV